MVGVIVAPCEKSESTPSFSALVLAPMTKTIMLSLLAAVAAPIGIYAVAQRQAQTLAPAEIAEAAPASDWRDIPARDLLMMDVAGGGRVVIQLAPDFAPVHVANIRKLAGQRWWDGTSINRVQDNYVVQWGDATEKKALPADVVAAPPSEYVRDQAGLDPAWIAWPDPYAKRTGFLNGWPVGGDGNGKIWLAHCYAMVGVGRNMAPDTGSGTELYAVIGQAPRHLDRNIALVGRVIEGMEFLASRPRGTAAMGFYDDPKQRIAITSIKPMTEADPGARSDFQYLSGSSFGDYEDARANRRDPFFNVPAGGADVCNIPVPIRRKS
jgi:peptidylprolyl isomerase